MLKEGSAWIWDAQQQATQNGQPAIVIPRSLRTEVLQRIHSGHFGEVKCFERARSSVYLSGYCDQVRNAVVSCSVCQEHRHANPLQPSHPISLLDHPFEKVGSDLLEYGGANYLPARCSKFAHSQLCTSSVPSMVTITVGTTPQLMHAEVPLRLDPADPIVREPLQQPTATPIRMAPQVPSPLPAARPSSPSSSPAAVDVSLFQGLPQISLDPPPSGRVIHSGQPYLIPLPSSAGSAGPV